MDSAISLVELDVDSTDKGKNVVRTFEVEETDGKEVSSVVESEIDDAADDGDDLNGSKEKGKDKRICRFDMLPLEVKMKIFKCFDVVDVVRVSMVCRSWHSLAFDGSLWSQLDVAPFYQKITADQLVSLWKAAGGFLRNVNFRGCVQLGASDLRGLAPYCPNIQSLQLSGCRNLDFGSVDFLLSHLHDLEELNLSGLLFVISPNCYTLAKECKRLKKVNLSWCQYVSQRGIESLVKGCRELTSLKLDGLPKITETTLGMIGELRRLQVLSLDSCPTVDDNSISALFQSGNSDNSSTTAATTTTYSLSPPPITHLNLSNNRNLTDNTLQDLADFCPTLTHLQLHNCPGFTDSGLIYLASKCTQLQAIDLEDCNSVNDDVLDAFATHLSKLRKICLSYCEQITDDGVTNLLRECTNITRIDLDQCQSLTDQVLRNLAEILTTAASMGLICDNAIDSPSGVDDSDNDTLSINSSSRSSASSNSRNQQLQLAEIVSPSRNMRPRSMEVEIFDCRNISIEAVRETVKKVSAAGVLLKLKGYYAWQATPNNNADGDDDDDSGRNAGNNGSFWQRARIFRHLRGADIIPDVALRFQFQATFRGAGFRVGGNAGTGRRLGQCILM